MELQVSNAGKTRLTASAKSTAKPAKPAKPGGRVSPGTTLKTKKKHVREVKRDHLSPWSANKVRVKSKSPVPPSLLTTSEAAKSPQQSVANHKAALLAKYIEFHSNPEDRATRSEREEREGEGEEERERLKGPQQQSVLSELIERGERLRDAMVLSVLKSHGGEGGGRMEEEWNDSRTPG